MSKKSSKGCGYSEGERKMGIAKLNQQLTAKEYPDKQSKDGNGGKGKGA